MIEPDQARRFDVLEFFARRQLDAIGGNLADFLRKHVRIQKGFFLNRIHIKIQEPGDLKKFGKGTGAVQPFDGDGMAGRVDGVEFFLHAGVIDLHGCAARVL